MIHRGGDGLPGERAHRTAGVIGVKPLEMEGGDETRAAVRHERAWHPRIAPRYDRGMGRRAKTPRGPAAVVAIVTTVAIVVLLGHVRLGHSAWAERASPSLIVRLEGRVVPDAKAANRGGGDGLSLSFPGPGPSVRWLSVTQIAPFGANPAERHQLLNALRPRNPSLVIAGPESLVDRARVAPVGARITMEGLLDQGSGKYTVSIVEVRGEPVELGDSSAGR